MTSKLRRLHRFRKLDVFAGNLVDGCAAGAPAHSRKAGGEGFLIATAKQEDREACVPDHGGKRLIEDAVAVAASFVYTIDTQECLLDLLFVGGSVHHSTAGRGQLHAEHMLETLAGVGPSAPAGFATLANAVLAKRAQLASVILVLVAWDEARRALAERLAASGIEVRAILVCEARDAPANAPAVLKA